MAELIRTSPTLTSGKPYLTEMRIKSQSGDETVSVLSPRASGDTAPTVDVSDDDFTTVKVLSRYSDGNKIGVAIGAGQSLIVDDVQSRVWNGRHAIAGAEAKPIIVQNGISLISAALPVDNFAAVAAELQTVTSWAAFFVVKRTVASFGGVAHLQFFGANVASDYQLMPLYFNQAGDVSASGVVNNVASGRTANEAFPINTLKIFAVTSRLGNGFQIWDDTAARIDTVNIGTGSGVSFSLFPDYPAATPVSYLGGTRAGGVTTMSAGNAILYRNLFYPRLDVWTNPHKFKKILSKLRIEYGITG